MSDMKTVTLRSFRRDSTLLDAVAEGEELIVTLGDLGSGTCMSFPSGGPNRSSALEDISKMKAPVSPDPVPASEWKGIG